MSELNIEKYIEALNNILGIDSAYLAGDKDVDAIVECIVKLKELTEEKNEVFEKGAENLTRLEEAYLKLESENIRLTEENKRLQKALNTDISIVRVSRGSGKTAHLREVGRIKIDAIRADTVRKMQEALEQRIHSKLSYHGWYLKETVIAEIAKEMLEDTDES